MNVFVESLDFIGAHGLYEHERKEGRKFSVDLLVNIDTNPTCQTDDIDETIDYRKLAEIILEVGQGESVSLIETLAGNILDLVFERFSSVSNAKITVRKKATGVPGDPKWVGVKMRRERHV